MDWKVLFIVLVARVLDVLSVKVLWLKYTSLKRNKSDRIEWKYLEHFYFISRVRKNYNFVCGSGVQRPLYNSKSGACGLKVYLIKYTTSLSVEQSLTWIKI